ncbi:MAG: hypothetical protein EOM22_11595 [Gammaproteobacteria bacterium]|nr:hypothetical protein [Gammaproteobacteria bacterium]
MNNDSQHNEMRIAHVACGTAREEELRKGCEALLGVVAGDPDALQHVLDIDERLAPRGRLRAVSVAETETR